MTTETINNKTMEFDDEKVNGAKSLLTKMEFKNRHFITNGEMTEVEILLGIFDCNDVRELQAVRNSLVRTFSNDIDEMLDNDETKKHSH